MAKSEPWICKSCGWRNRSTDLGPFCSSREYGKCSECKTPRTAKPRNVAVIVERTGFGNLKTYEKRKRCRVPVDVQTWPNGISWG